jgi:hypothetical protein
MSRLLGDFVTLELEFVDNNTALGLSPSGSLLIVVCHLGHHTFIDWSLLWGSMFGHHLFYWDMYDLSSEQGSMKISCLLFVQRYDMTPSFFNTSFCMNGILLRRGVVQLNSICP